MSLQQSRRIEKLEARSPASQDQFTEIQLWAVEPGTMNETLAAIWRKGMEGFEPVNSTTPEQEQFT